MTFSEQNLRAMDLRIILATELESSSPDQRRFVSVVPIDYGAACRYRVRRYEIAADAIEGEVTTSILRNLEERQLTSLPAVQELLSSWAPGASFVPCTDSDAPY